MRKMTMMCMAALLLMAVSCKKEKANEEYTGEGFRATTESHTGEGDSKTQLLGNLSVTWCDGDEIKVFSDTDQNGKKFSAASAGTAADFNPKEDVTDAFFTQPYKAFYPYDSETGIDQISLKGTQHYTKTDGVLTFAPGENPMAATSTTTELPFKNLCGILKFQLYSESSCTVKSLCVTSLKSGEQLWGTGTVTFNGADATIDQLTGGTGSITLDCGEGVNLGTSEGTSTEFLVVIPGGALSEGFTVTVTDADDKVWSKTATANNTITKSKIKAMPKLAVTTKPVEFTVDASGTTVEFAPGNLYWDGSAFRFEANQWDYRHYTGKTYDAAVIGGVSGTTPSGTVGSFFWSKTASVAYAENYSDDDASTDDVFFTEASGFQVNDYEANTWRTLTIDEWNYLLYSRDKASNLCLWKELDSNTHNGLVILPDGTEDPETVMGSINSTSDLASSGAVFLPAAGCRFNTDVNDVGSDGYYWSSTPYEDYEDDEGEEAYAYRRYFRSDCMLENERNRNFGYAVRLVSNN